MQKSKLLGDAFYDEQINRMSGLAKFPHLPDAQKELRRALRRVSSSDREFLYRLVSEIVDTSERCPTPAEVLRRAGEMRQQGMVVTVGDPHCAVCHGSGWESFTRRVNLGGLSEYHADFSQPCKCRGLRRAV